MSSRWKLAFVAVVVAALVVIAGLSYVWLTSGDVSSPRTPAAALTKTNLTDGVKFNIISVESEVTWNQVRLHVTEGLQVGHWEPSEDDFEGTWEETTAVLKNITLGERTIGCTINDVGILGRLGQGDEFVFRGSTGIYMFTLVYEPTGGMIYQDSFFIRSS